MKSDSVIDWACSANVLTSYLLEDKATWQAALRDNPMLAAAADLCRDIESKLKKTTLIVGGSVRDIITGRSIHDVDIATGADINQVEEIYGAHEIGQSKGFGIVVVPWKGFQFEVAQFRSESGYSDGRRPDSVQAIDTFQGDAARRDFTFNAIGLDPDGNLHDYFNGVSDLNDRVVRTVGKPYDRFSEDALRILRGVRFAVKMGFGIEDETLAAMRELSNSVTKLSGERIRDEFLKVADSGKALADFVELLDGAGVLEKVLPEIKALQDLPHSAKHHPEGGVWKHVLAALRASRSRNPVDNLAVLFHDIGKATTRGGTDEEPTYHGHEAAGIPLFQSVAKRLRLSVDQKEAIELAIHSHMMGHNFDKLTDKKVIGMRQNKHWPTLYNAFHADAASRAPLFDPDAFERKLERAEIVFKKFGAKQEFEQRMSALINGNLILKLRPGISGKEVGRIKDHVRDLIVQRGFDISPEEVESAIMAA